MPLRNRLLPALLAAALASSAYATSALAADKPLWELGAGVSALQFPDYRGSNHSQTYAVPFPYVVYRGDFLKADRNGLRGIFLDSEWVNLNLSVGASLPVDSKNNEARQGIPNLKPTLEVGPSLDLTLWRDAGRKYKLDLRLPVRNSFTVGGAPQSIGWVFSPRLNLDITDPAGLVGWNLGLLAGPMYDSRRYDQYFYSVDPAYAQAGRPAYSAGGGYAGTQMLLAISKRYSKFWVGGFLRRDDLSNARFADSPLVTSRHYFAAGIGAAWVLGESERKVPGDE
jgi:outer membrane scaffolding protein for murein synthesis (MipA/OmpV family)